MTFQKGIVTALATGAVFMSSLTPMVLADNSSPSNSVVESGNGAVSQNTVTTNQNTSTSVSQNNNADITNNVDSSANTGGNHADFNTGGSTGISTGDASNTTTITNQANANIANLGGCNTCSNGGNLGSVSILGNGAFSDNTVRANSSNNTTLNQNNNANFTNNVTSQANTGKNTASYNTGGDTTIQTGNATNDTTIQNKANANIASLPAFGNGSGFGSAVIAGNGAESDNAITLNNKNKTNVRQNNWADITNNVTSGAQTGKNKADFNTGGDVFIGTGAASNYTAISNMANFNAADLSACGCLTFGNGDVTIYGNGAFSKNKVTSNFGNRLTAAQDNGANIVNNLRNGSRYGNGTGNNTASANTGGYNNGTDYIFTGGQNSSTDLGSSANKNLLGNGLGFDWNGTNVQVGFDWNSILNQLPW